MYHYLFSQKAPTRVIPLEQIRATFPRDSVQGATRKELTLGDFLSKVERCFGGDATEYCASHLLKDTRRVSPESAQSLLIDFYRRPIPQICSPAQEPLSSNRVLHPILSSL